jgi:hypothetical protein
MLSFEKYTKKKGLLCEEPEHEEIVNDPDTKLTDSDINKKQIAISQKFNTAVKDVDARNVALMEAIQLWKDVGDDKKVNVATFINNSITYYYNGTVQFIPINIINLLIKLNIQPVCFAILKLYIDLYQNTTTEKYKAPPQLINYALNFNDNSWLYFIQSFFERVIPQKYNLIPKEFLTKIKDYPIACYDLLTNVFPYKKELLKNPDLIPYEIFKGVLKDRNMANNYLSFLSKPDTSGEKKNLPSIIKKWIELDYGSTPEEYVAYFKHQINHKLLIPDILINLLKDETLDEEDFKDKVSYYFYLIYIRDNIYAGELFNTLSFDEIKRIEDYCNTEFVFSNDTNYKPKSLFFSSLTYIHANCSAHYIDYKINQPEGEDDIPLIFRLSLKEDILDSRNFCQLIVKYLNDEVKFNNLISLFIIKNKDTEEVHYTEHICSFIVRLAILAKTKTFFKVIDNIVVASPKLMERFLNEPIPCCNTLINLIKRYKRDTNDEITEIDILLKIIGNTSEYAKPFVERMIKSVVNGNLNGAHNCIYFFVKSLIDNRLVTNDSDVPKEYLDYIISNDSLLSNIINNFVIQVKVNTYDQIPHILDAFFNDIKRYNENFLSTAIYNLSKNKFEFNSIPFEKYDLSGKNDILKLLTAFYQHDLDIPKKLSNIYINKFGDSNNILKQNPELLFAFLDTTQKTSRKLDSLPNDKIEELKKYKDNLSENFIKLSLLPKLMADKYNKLYHGAFIHATSSLGGTVAVYKRELQPTGDNTIMFPSDVKKNNNTQVLPKEHAEVCVSTLRANTTFHAPKEFYRNAVILIGFGKVEYLFDFDAYSHIDANTGKRYATSSNIKSDELHKSDSNEVFGNGYNAANHYDEGFVDLPKAKILLAVINDDLIKPNNKQFRDERMKIEKLLKQINPHITIISNTRFEQIRNSDELLKGLYELEDKIKDKELEDESDYDEYYSYKENLSFDQYMMIMENKVEIPLERAYELFKAEYEKSTGKSWTYEKFLQRAGNWEFYGDMDGFVAIRKQNSGFVKFVGMAGSMKSKYKGFKEVVALGLPLWAMVTKEIADMCKKTGMRSPNRLEMFAIKKALLNNPAIMGDAKVLNYLKDGGVEIEYPDIGKTIKYFVATPAYYTKARKMLIKV